MGSIAGLEYPHLGGQFRKYVGSVHRAAGTAAGQAGHHARSSHRHSVARQPGRTRAGGAGYRAALPCPTGLPVNYRWILFDADDTLFHFDAYQGLRRMFERHAVDFTPAHYAQYQEVNKPLWVDYQNGTITAEQLQTTRFDGWARRLGVAATDLNEAFLLAMAEICTLLPGAQALLDALHDAGVRMGLITNGFTALQLARLERTGLREHFDPLVISEQLGVAKPDVRIFEHALERMGQPPREQVLMVGDNPHSDILGGLNAGLHTCWFNPHGHEAPEGIAPHHQVSSLHELQALLLG